MSNVSSNTTIINNIVMEPEDYKIIKEVNSNNSSPPNTPPRKYRAVVCPGAPNRNRVPVPNEQ
jgi:hypothetical protein